MRIVVFGLTVSSSWGNGHATLWRGLIGALARRGHRVDFFERDQPFYAPHRDLLALPGGGALVLYPDWESVRRRAREAVATADVAIVTSYCPDGLDATDLVLDGARGARVFYDLDTPVTLARLGRGESTGYIGPRGLGGFDLVLSYTGGRALDGLAALGAGRVVPLYGHVDPAVHRPVPPVERFRSDLSYLGTYAADRQAALEELFVEPARARPGSRFLIGGAQYPDSFPWTDNIWFVRHLPPADHPAFFCSGRLTLNVTREAMAAMGWCPSGRLFEAAACGAPILTDVWEGLDAFFEPGQEVLTATTREDAAAALDLGDAELARIGQAARERTLAEHTSDARARDLEAALDLVGVPVPAGA